MPPERFEKNKYYHVYNKGVDQQVIFADKQDYSRFLTCLNDFNSLDVIGSLWLAEHRRGKRSFEEAAAAKPAVEILAYCLLPDHFHLLVKNLGKGNLSVFLHKLTMGHTKYFNHRHKRAGALFQGTFKAVEVSGRQGLEYVSVYINHNAKVHKLDNAGTWPWCTPGKRSQAPDIMDKVVDAAKRRKLGANAYWLE